MSELNHPQSAAMREMSRPEMIALHGGAQVDYFLRLHGVDGEATSAPSVSEIVVTKVTDCASTNLFRA